MPPKGRPRRNVPYNGQDNSVEEVMDIISIGDASDSSSVVMTERRPVPTQRGRAANRARRAPRGGHAGGRSRSGVTDIYHDLLSEALNQPSVNDAPERPRKRRRVRQPGENASTEGSVQTISEKRAGAVIPDDDDSVPFEDILPISTQQTVYRDTDEESEGSDGEWQELELSGGLNNKYDEVPDDLDLTLRTKFADAEKPIATRRRVVNKADKTLRLEIHKMHLLCLISNISRRSRWCDDESIQSVLLPMVNKKIKANLRPGKELSQFRQKDLLLQGLDELIPVWNARFTVTARGLRKALWAEDEHALSHLKLPPDAEEAMSKTDFMAAAQSLKSSRDIGVLLFCSLLRATGLEVRLICSLQPLPFSTNVSTLAAPPTGSPVVAKTPTSDQSEAEEVDIQGAKSPFLVSGSGNTHMPFTARRRLGHPHAADYQLPSMTSPVRPTPPKPKLKIARIRESPFPIFWVEVLDEAHQKWIPVDPLVTRTVGKPSKFEPPASDPENSMTYVFAFEDDGVVRDVTRRYTRAYNSKTRKLRVEYTDGGEKWLKRTLKVYKRDWHRDLDAIEDHELNSIEAREPMPKNIIDFKDHPTYALERHMKANEVFITRHEIGKVATGRDASVAGGRKMESVYRRSDVKIARSADRWYRLGRDIKMGEQPVKIVASRRKENTEDQMEGEDPGTGLYTEQQTEIYIPPPVVNGRIPRNTYGNLDIYVPSMVPAGGARIPFEEAARAARLLGVDYADAVTGFKFQGRRGTPIVNGVVAAIEYRDAIFAVIEGFRDDRARAEEEMKSLAALRMWKRFLVSLRIKARVDTYEVKGEVGDADDGGGFLPDDGDPGSADAGIGEGEDEDGMQSEEYEDYGGGGFFPE